MVNLKTKRYEFFYLWNNWRKRNTSCHTSNGRFIWRKKDPGTYARLR